MSLLAGCSALFESDEETPTETEPSTSTPRREQSERTKTPRPDDRKERRGITFQRVVNAVDDLGMDPSGEKPIDQKLKNNIQNGTVVLFPPGDYLLTTDAIGFEITDLQNFGIAGLGDHRNDVVFRKPPGEGGWFFNIHSSEQGSENILFENFTLHNGNEWRSSLGIIARVTDNLQVHDYEVMGKTPIQQNGDVVDPLAIYVVDPDGVAVVDGLVRKGPTQITTHGSKGNGTNEGGMYVGRKHRGTLYVRNSHIENTGTNGIYSSKTPGNIRIENCFFKNNNQTSLRIGGGGSYVEDCTFVCDTEDAHPENEYLVGGYVNPHAIIWESGEFAKTGGHITGCDFVWKNSPERAHPIVWVDGSCGAIEVSNCRFRIDQDNVGALQADDPTDPRLGDTAARPWDVTLDGVSITGSGGADRNLVEVTNRDGSSVTNSCLSVTGDDTDGIALVDSDDSSVTDTNIDVTGRATQFTDSNVATSNITHGASCPVPDTSWEGSDDTSNTDTDSGGETSTSDPLSNTLTVQGPGEATEYQFTVTGDLQENAEAGELSQWDDLSGSTARGWVTDTNDGYRFSGTVSDFEFLQNETTVLVNGTEIPLTEFGQSLRVAAPDDADVDYAVTVSGAIDTAEGGVSDAVSVDDSGATAEATCASGTEDAWTFSGSVESVTLSVDADVFVDGQQIDPETLQVVEDSGGGGTDSSGDSGTEQKRSLEIVGTGEATSYLVAVGGTLEEDPDGGPLSEWDALGEQTADGWVTEKTDSFLFTGPLYQVEIDGSAEVYLDGEQVDPTSVGYQNELRVVSGETTTYEVTVDEAIATDLTSVDTASKGFDDGKSIEGTVSDQEHVFLFEESITSFQYDTEPTVYLNGEQVDPATLGQTEEETLPNAIIIDGMTSDKSQYEFEVTGAAQKSSELGTAESGDTITDGVVSGTVEDDKDGYRFEGDLVSLDLSGSATVRFEESSQ
jgi:hypothetical protein